MACEDVGKEAGMSEIMGLLLTVRSLEIPASWRIRILGIRNIVDGGGGY
jgi:hypothetical protein